MFAAYHPQWDGEGRKWFTDSSGKWHFLNELGEVFQWSHPSEPFSGTRNAGNDNQASRLNFELDHDFADNSARSQTVVSVGDVQIVQSGEAAKYGGGAAYFDGWGDYIRVSNSNLFDQNSKPFTLEMRIRPDHGNYYRWQCLAGKLSYNPGEASFHLWLHKGKLKLWASKDGRSYSINCLVSSVAIQSGKWSHIALVSHKDRVEIYLDGERTTLAVGESIFISPTDLNIGGLWNWGGLSLSGLIDSVKLSAGANYSEDFDPDAAPELSVPIATKKVSPIYYFQPSNLLD